MNYKTIAKNGENEQEIKKSRFICQMKRISSEEEGKAFIADIKKKHYKATHSCSAMIIGENGLIKKSSDDGEPSGTAGVPMLTVLEKQQLTNVVAVVTRYFGGIKLGAGGLIRAYAGSVSEAINTLGKVEVKQLEGLKIQLSYTQYQTLSQFLEAENLQEYHTEFLADVTTFIYLEKEKIDATMARLVEFYNGKIKTSLEGNQIVEIPF
ncbi:YigZ family protein [Streptococcus pacificus]|uniref:YigZ family protein n=1 Tax=Streptococcus pacificus TaxID=2740577 RepID=A0ABS0ZI67_9STRE|nr:YigZ family protein [Streptococcus pacificus]MBJ8325680.1 YigZ family protein [Streptococcus pacificus]